ncbi:general transcription factor IIF subunit 1-like [Clytia hemisphaerica]
MHKPTAIRPLGMKPAATSRPPGVSASVLPPGISKPPEQYTEYKLRVPKNLVKRYNVMKINSPRPIKLDQVKEANMVRKTKKQVYVEDDTVAMPTTGAGSVYNYERKEEARRKRRGYITRKISPEDLPYALRLNGKGGKRYTGRKEPILDHSAYFIITQSPDGVFEAVPVQAWYNFMPDIDYATLSADQVEQEFSKRDRRMNAYQEKYGLKPADEESGGSKVQRRADGSGLVIHDDDLDEIDNEFDDPPSDSERGATKKEKGGAGKNKKNIYGGKKKKGRDEDDFKQDSDEEEEADMLESKEVDYMSESSSEDELKEMDDEPDPEKASTKQKAKDDLNLFSDTSSEDEDDEEEDKQLNQAGKQLKAMLKSESGERSSDEEDDDEDIDDQYSKNAMLIQGKDGKKKKKNGSNNGSKPTSRSSTPVQHQKDQDSSTSDTLSQAAKSLKDAGSKRGHDSSSVPSPGSKKQKFNSSVSSGGRSNSPLTVPSSAGNDRSASPAVRSSTPSDGHNITESAIRRYLTHKPMTTADLMRKFKPKKTGLSKEQTVSAIAAILKKIQPHQEKIEGKLYLSIKNKK